MSSTRALNITFIFPNEIYHLEFSPLFESVYNLYKFHHKIADAGKIYTQYPNQIVK